MGNKKPIGTNKESGAYYCELLQTSNYKQVSVIQAGTAPNPDAKIRVEDYSPATGAAKKALELVQRLEYPGKRATRKGVASENVEILKLTLENSRLDAIYKLKKAFYDILLAGENLSLYGQNHTVTNDLLELVNHRLKQGFGGEFEVAKANVELIKSEKLLRESEAQLALAKSQLNVLLNNPPDNGIDIKGKIATYSPRKNVSREEIIRNAVNSHPAVLAQTHRIKGLEQNVLLALNSTGIPEFSCFTFPARSGYGIKQKTPHRGVTTVAHCASGGLGEIPIVLAP